ncbi:MAG: LytTR family DNA-binding domain-containing protein [Clostridium sp.]
MKITINESPEFEDLEIIINCNCTNESLLKLISSIRAYDKKIKGTCDGNVFILDADEVFYFESVDKKTFIYMNKEIYETSQRLYELEERFSNADFFRASKSTIINISKIKSITPMFGGRLTVVLENDEELVVSRQYVAGLKLKLNL